MNFERPRRFQERGGRRKICHMCQAIFTMGGCVTVRVRFELNEAATLRGARGQRSTARS